MYCQNRLCHYNNTTDRIRAKKSSEPHYVNRTARGYLDMFCSQGCLYEFMSIYKDRIIQAVGEQGRRTRKATDQGPSEAWSREPDYNLDYETGYSEARQRFFLSWISNNLKD